MGNKITTTIRWDGKDLDEVKDFAKQLGLPVSLLVKSLVLARVRKIDGFYDTVLKRELLAAKKEAELGNVDIFNDKQSLLADLNSKMKK